jgi:hypothetical protein
MSQPSPAATAVPAGPPACLDSAPPLAGKRRGNPDLGLSLRCGARTRGGCPCRAPAIHGKLRCRRHGGRSTGPRTEEGTARLRTARTIHGGYGAEMRARIRYSLTALRRGQVGNAAVCCVDLLPPDFAARLWQVPSELMPPLPPTGGLTPAEDSAVLRAEAEALAPWRLAIAEAGRAGRAGGGRCRGHTEGSRAPTAPPNPLPQGEGENFLLSQLVPTLMGRAGRGVAGGVSPDCATKAHAPVCACDMDAAALAASPAAPAATQAKAHAPEPAADWSGVSPVAARAMAGGPIQQSAKAHAPERDPAVSDAAPAALLNRAARRRWKSLQRHLHRAPARAPIA